MDVTKEVTVSLIMKGRKKEKLKVDARLPIFSSLLDRLLLVAANVCSSVPEMHLLQSAFSIAFFCALQVDKLAAP